MIDMDADGCICLQIHAYASIWTHMAAYGCPWLQGRKSPRSVVPAAELAFARIWWHMHAYGRICAHIHGYARIWTHMDPYGCSWLHGHKSPQFTVRAAGLTFGRVWLHMDAYGRQCLHIHAYTCIWTHMHAYGRMWLHMDAFDFRLCFRSLTDRRPLM